MNKLNIRQRFALASLISLALSHAAQAQTSTSWTSISDLRDAAGTIVAALILIAFVGALVLWIAGSMQKENNPGAATACFKTAWILVIGLPVISLFFYVFIGRDAVVTPKF